MCLAKIRSQSEFVGLVLQNKLRLLGFAPLCGGQNVNFYLKREKESSINDFKVSEHQTLLTKEQHTH